MAKASWDILTMSDSSISFSLIRERLGKLDRGTEGDVFIVDSTFRFLDGILLGNVSALWSQNEIVMDYDLPLNCSPEERSCSKKNSSNLLLGVLATSTSF